MTRSRSAGRRVWVRWWAGLSWKARALVALAAAGVMLGVAAGAIDQVSSLRWLAVVLLVASGLAALVPQIAQLPVVQPLQQALQEGAEHARVRWVALRTHFDPHGRGVAQATDSGWYFTGRVHACHELIGWLTEADPGNALRLVTGRPGTGKSAVLGWLVLMADPAERAKAPIGREPGGAYPPDHSIHAYIHARGQTLERLVAHLADFAGLPATTNPQELLLGIQGRGTPLVAVIDGLDEAEAENPARICRELLGPVADRRSGVGLRLLVGTRSSLLAALSLPPDDRRVLDLDDERYYDPEDLVDYADRCLRLTGDPRACSPYRDDLAQARRVARAIATRADGVFLIAQLTARALARDPHMIDVAEPDWQQQLPDTIGRAMDEYLARLPNPRQGRDLLLPLAYVHGDGLTPGLWAILATAFGTGTYGEHELHWLLGDTFAPDLLERIDHPDGSSWRLFHQALAEHLRDRQQRAGLLTRRQADERIVAVLIERAPRRAGTDQPDWLAADPYARAHLATHASRTGHLDRLLADPGFLVAADPDRLLEALPSVSGQDPPPISHRLLHRVGSRLRRRPDEERAAILELGARRLGAEELGKQLAALRLSRPWSVRWAHQPPAGADRIVGWHDGPVRALAVAEREGRLVAVSGGADGMVRIWDLRAGSPLLSWPHGPAEQLDRGGQGGRQNGGVMAVAVGELADGPVVVSGGADGMLRCWRLADGSPRGGPLATPWSMVWSVAVGERAGRPIIVAGGDGKRGDWKRVVCIWDLETWDLEAAELLDTLEPDCQSRGADDLLVSAVATGTCGGRPVVVAGHDCGMHQWTWTGATWVSTTLIPEAVPGFPDRVRPWAVALGTLHGRPTAVCGGHPDWITAFDLQSGARATPAFDTPDGDVLGVAVGELDGYTVAVSGNYFGHKGDHGILRVWDLDNEEQPLRGSLIGHYAGVRALAITRLNDRTVVVSGGEDHTVRVWDLATGLQQPQDRSYHDMKWLVASRLKGRPVVVSKSNIVTPRITISKSDTWHEESQRDPFQRTPYAATPPPPSVIRIWDQADGEPIGLTPPLDLDHLGRLCAALPIDDTVLGVECVDTPAQLTGWEYRPPRIQSGRAISTQNRAYLHVWDLQGDTKVGRPIPSRPLAALDYNIAVGRLGDQPVVAFCDEDGRIQVWDVRTGEPVWKEPLPTFDAGSALRAFGAPAGRPIAVVTAPWTFGIWDLQRREPAEPLAKPPSMQGEGWTTFPAAVGELAGRPVVVYSGYGRPIRVWDATTGRECERAIWVDAKISSITIAPDSTILAGGPAGIMLALRVEASFFDPLPRAATPIVRNVAAW